MENSSKTNGPRFIWIDDEGRTLPYDPVQHAGYVDCGYMDVVSPPGITGEDLRLERLVGPAFPVTADDYRLERALGISRPIVLNPTDYRPRRYRLRELA